MRLNSRIRPFFLILLVSLVYSVSGLAQQALVSAFSVNEGLSQSTITAIRETRSRYLWVGTGHGLNRFNGYEFRNYLHSPEPGSLSHDVIRGIFEADDRVMWIATENGLNVFDPSTGNFSQVSHPAFESDIPEVIATRDGKVLVVMVYGGIGWFTRSTGGLELLCSDTIAKGYCLSKDGQQIQFINSRDEWVCHDLQRGEVFRMFLPGLRGKWVPSIIQLTSSEFLICTPDGALVVNNEMRTVREFSDSVSGENIMCAAISAQNEVWLAIQNRGIVVCDLNGVLQAEYGASFQPPGLPSFGKIQVQRMMFDYRENLWIGTDGHGLIRFSTQNLRFGNVVLPVQEREIRKDAVWSFLRLSADKLWVGVSDGILQLDKRYNPVNRFEGWGEGTPSRVNVMLKISPDLVLVAGRDKIVEMDPGGRKLKMTAMNAPGSDWRIVSGVVRNDGLVWLGASHGLVLYKPGQGVVDTMVSFPVTFLGRDSRGNTLVSLRRKGVAWLTDDGGMQWKLLFDQHPATGSITAVRAILSDQHTHWLGTTSGLYEFDGDWTFRKFYGVKEGLPNSYINGLAAGSDGEIWISTNKGIVRFDPKNSSFQHYDFHDGLQSNEFNAGAYYRDDTGEIYFGGIEGMNHFNPSALRLRSATPEVVGENLRIGNLMYEYLDYGPIETQTDYADNFFSLELCALDLTQPDRNEFMYILEGYDKDFYYSGVNRSVRYSGLPPGRYVFKARASVDGVSWSEPVILFTLLVRAPFWMTWWFVGSVIFLVVILFGLSVVWYQRRKYRGEIQELRFQRDIESIRTRIANDIHDEIGAGLTRITLLSDSVLLERDVEHSRTRLRSLNEVARSLSSSLREVLWSTNPKYDTLQELIIHMRYYASEFLEDVGIEVEFHFPDNVEGMHISPSVRRDLFLITKEALNNIAKHSGASRVTYSVESDRDYLSIRITDNGSGMKPDMVHGVGMTGIARRAAENRFEVRWEKGPKGGTTFSLSGKLKP